MSDSDEETTTDHQLKFVLLGDGASGKVSLVDHVLKPLIIVIKLDNSKLKFTGKVILFFTRSNCGTYFIFRLPYA